MSSESLPNQYYSRKEGCGAVQHHPHQYYQQLCSGIQSPVLRGDTFFACHRIWLPLVLYRCSGSPRGVEKAQKTL